MAAFCDYDRDGFLDVFIQTNILDASHPNGQRDYLFHNNGDGTFTDVTERAGISGEAQGHSAVWWDYDGDGWPDLYVANDFAMPDKLYRNNRDGTFTDAIDSVVPHTTYSSMGSDLGDVNNDGLIDLFVAEMAPTTHQKDQRGMALRARPAHGPSRRLCGRPPVHAKRALHQHGEGPLPGGRLPRRPLRDRLDLVAAPRGPGQRRPAGPLRDQRDEPRAAQRATSTRARSCGDPRREGAHRQGEPAACRAAPRVPEHGRPALRGRQRRLGAQPEGRQLRLGFRRPRWRRQPRHRVRELRGGRHAPAQRRGHGPQRPHRAARNRAQTGSASARRCASRRIRASRSARSCSPAASFPAPSRSCTSDSGRTRR